MEEMIGSQEKKDLKTLIDNIFQMKEEDQVEIFNILLESVKNKFIRNLDIRKIVKDNFGNLTIEFKPKISFFSQIIPFRTTPIPKRQEFCEELIRRKKMIFREESISNKIEFDKIDAAIQLKIKEITDFNSDKEFFNWLIPSKERNEILTKTLENYETNKELSNKIEKEMKDKLKDAFLSDFLIGGLMISGLFLLIDSFSFSVIITRYIGISLMVLSIILYYVFFKFKLWRSFKRVNINDLVQNSFTK